MTIYELMVIAVAAGVFMIVNIIMWSVISHKEKKEAEKNSRSASEAVPQQENIRSAAISSDGPEAIRREKPDSFIIEENIILIHTDETL